MPIKVTNQNNEETNNNDNADSLYQSNMQMYNAYQNGDLFDYDDTPQQVSSDSEWADFGNSMFDNSMVMNVSEGDLNEMRANNQGWLSKTGSALGNATVTAATTFLDNTVGFLWGIGSAAVNGDASKLWDNDFSNAMADINDWANENMPYYTTKYDQDLLPFVGNFILNDLVRNSGFQIGTGLSMIVPGAILKVPGSAFKLTKMASNFMKSGRAIRTGSAMKDLALSTWMSFGEASIEALNNKRDFVKYQTQLMNDEFAQKTAALDEQWKQLVMQKYGGNEEAARASMDFNEYYNQKQELAAQKAQKAKFIEHEATKVGDITALANMAVLAPTNFMTFGKAFTGYNLNKRFGQIATDIVDAEGNVLKKNAFERTAKEVARTGKIEVKNPNYGKWGYNKEGKLVKDTEKYITKEAKVQMRGKEKSALWEVGKNMFWEGNEEMMQEVGAQYSTALAETDMLNYEALAESGMAYDDILKQINSSWINFGEMANAFGKVYTDPAQYRQFFGGAFGMLISPHFTRKPGGGVQFHLNNIGGEMAAIREQNSTNALIAEDINKMLNSDESKNYLKGMLRHAALEHVKQDAVTADSKIDYENADFAQFVSDITTMSNAGKLPLLQAHLDGLRNMSDEELEETCMNMCTDKKVTYTDENGKKKTKTIKVGDFVDNNGNFIGNTPEGKQKVRDKLNKRIDRLQKDIDLYQSTMNDIDGATGGALDHETLAAFTWEKAQVMNKYSRAKEIIGGEASAKQIGLFRERIGSHITTLTDKLTQSQNDLKAKKERLSHLPKVEGKPVEASDMQKNLESSIKILTNEINIATELSQLCNDMQALQVYNADHKDDKTAVTKLFEKYADFAESMPNVAKAMGLIDENGKKTKKKGKDGKEIELISSLEDMLYSGKFNALMRLNQKDDAEISAEEQQLMNDYADAAKLNYRARQTEASIDNLIDDPTQYTAHRAELQQRILEHENKKTISKIQKEIEKGLDEGRITLDNLEEESKKITDSINSINSERGAARQLFDRAVAALSNTPYDELRQIAIRNIMQSKKYKNLGDMRDLINYVYMNIAANPKLSDAEKQVAMETFNKFVKGKKSIDDVYKAKVKSENVDVNSLYVLDTPENQEAKRALIGKDPKISLDNYKYTEQSYNAAQIAKNEIPQIINDAVERIYKAKTQPELADQLTTLGIDENKVAAGTESAKTRAEIDNKAKSIEQGINKLLESFKGGEILNNEEKNELFNKVQDLIDETFNSDDYADEYKAEIDNLNIRWKAQSLYMIKNNLEQRVANKYNDTEIEGRIEVEKAFDEINKEVSKIQRSLEQSKGGAAFNDIFDRIAKEDYSVEPKNSFDIYYNSNGTIYRGHAVPCESLLNGRKCYAVAQQLDVDSFQYDIIDENGAIIGTLFSDELVEPSKRGESIKLDFAKLTSFDVNAPNLQSFREITTLKVPNITSEKTKRDVTERCKACRESFKEDGMLDENGETKLQSNILSTIAKANMIMNAELTESKAEIEDVIETPTEIKKEHTGIKYFLLQDEDGNMIRVMFPSNGNRVTFKDENGKTTTKKYSKALFKKEGYEGVIRETYGNDVEIVESSHEEWNPKAKVETKQEVQSEQETQSVVTTTTPTEINNEQIEQQPSTTETPTQSTVVEQKTQQRKKTEAKRKRAISQLDEQIAELDSMLERLQDAAKQNPQYHDTVRTVQTFKQYVEFVRNNYKALGEPKNVVLDENQVFSMMDSFRQQLGKIFGNDVQFLRDEEIEQAAKNTQAQFQIGKKASTEFDDVNSKREFKQSLYRGQAGKPKIDKDGNLILHPTYDNLSKNTGISFANVRGAAEDYGRRYAKSPYIIELDVDYIDKTHPLKEGTAKGSRFIGDEYGEGQWEERLSDDNDIIIPKGNYKIHHQRTDLSMYSNRDLRVIIEHLEEKFNIQDEEVFSAFGSRISQSDINEINDELEWRITNNYNVESKFSIDSPYAEYAPGYTFLVKKLEDELPFSKSNGKIYGFANEGKVVINKDKFRLDTPVHEYTHLWDKACIKHSPELWKRGVELMKQTDEWQRVIDDDNYANIKGNEDLVASEVHSRLSGMLAAGKAIEFAGNKRIKKGFWAKLIEWFRQFKDFTLRHVFGMSKEDAQKVTLEQFLSAPVADFMLGTDPRDVNNINYTIASKPKKQAKPVNTSLKVGDTVQYSGVAKKAVVRSITSKGITIETDDGRQYKNVAPRHLQYLYGQKPSANAKFEDLDEAVSPEEFIARKLVGVKINDTKKDITNLDKKLASKNGKTIDKLVLAIKDEIPFSISDDEIKDEIIDIASGRSINDIKQYAIDAHYAAQDAEYQAQISAIDNAQTTIQGETETFTPDEFYDDVDSVFDDEARNAIDSQIADEEYERSYQEYLEQRANEQSLTDEQWFEIFGEEPQPDPVVEQIKTKTEELKDKVGDEVPPTPFNIINDESGLDTLKNLAKKAKSEEAQPLDTFKPAISEWWIDDKSIPAIVGLRKKYPKANFEYIYQLYKSTGAYDYVKEGKLRKDQEVYIGYGQVGKLGNGTPLYNVVFFVKDDKGNYQLIGTLSDTANQDPKTAKELHEQVEKLYNEQDTNGFFIDITITNTKPYVSEASVRGQNVVVASGEKTFHFSILAPNGNLITTTVSKVLNGSLMWSETQHSLKDTTLPDGKTIAKAISDNENGKHVRIGFFDRIIQLHDNMTADEQQIELNEGFRNEGSKTKGHIVLILNKPDGRYQLVPMHVALFGDLMDNPYNPIVNDVNNILKKAWQIYSDNSMSIDDKDFELTKSGGIIQQLNEKLHFSGGQLHLFFEGKNGGISLSANGKAKVKNADGTLPRPKSEAEFLQLFNYQLADCMININEKNISDPKKLNKLIMSDVFSTNLSGTDFRNAFFTVKPIDAKGKIKEVYRDMPEQYILKNNQLKKIYGEKVATIEDTDVYMCEDLDGDISLYGVKQGTDEYNSDLLKNITTPSQRARMLAYAKIKAGMNPKGEFERKDIPADYIQEIDGKEYLVHPTIYGDEEYYDTETFVKQNPDAVGEETQEGGQQAENPVTTYKPQEHKPIVNEKLIKDGFTSSKFAKAFIELERLINNPDSKENLLKSTIDSISKEQLEDYIKGDKQRLSTSTKRTMLSLESRFGIETLKMFAAVKDIYDSNLYSDLYNLLDSVTDTDGNIDYSAFTQEQIDKIFDRNKIITDDNMFDKNTECEAPF